MVKLDYEVVVDHKHRGAVVVVLTQVHHAPDNEQANRCAVVVDEHLYNVSRGVDRKVVDSVDKEHIVRMAEQDVLHTAVDSMVNE